MHTQDTFSKQSRPQEEIYEVDAGLQWIYYKLSSVETEMTSALPVNFVEINYCKDGEFSCEFDTHSVGIVQAGDFAMNLPRNPTHNCSFPLGHYEGITILLDLDKISRIQRLPSGFEIDLDQIIEQLCPKKHCFFLKQDSFIQSLFDPLYEISSHIRPHMHLFKWWELLLYLSDPQTQLKEAQTAYLPYNQFQQMKNVEVYLTHNMHDHITIPQAAEHFSMSPTALKEQFQSVFGKPIFTYMREYRCHAAACMLRQENSSIGNIVQIVFFKTTSPCSLFHYFILGGPFYEKRFCEI